MGISRSASIAMAYLMFKKRQNFKETWEMIGQFRPRVYPNRGFRQQLRVWFDLRFNLYDNGMFKKWRREYQLIRKQLEDEELAAKRRDYQNAGWC